MPEQALATDQQAQEATKKVNRFAPLPARKLALFLNAYTKCYNFNRACRLAGLRPAATYQRKKWDKRFARALARAKERVIDGAEEKIYERGFVGWEEPIYQKGELVGHKRVYDGKLAIRWLEAERPAKWAQQQLDQQSIGQRGPQVQVSIQLDRYLAEYDERYKGLVIEAQQSPAQLIHTPGQESKPLEPDELGAGI